MKALGPILFVALIAGGIYLYLKSGGSLSGTGAHGGDPGSVVNQGEGAAVSAWDRLRSDPRFYTFVGCGIVAGLGVMTWRRIGGFGRGAVLVLATIALVVVFTK